MNAEPETRNQSGLQTPLQFLKGVGPKRAEQLAKFGLDTVEDLLFHLPFRYEDRRQIGKLTQAVPGAESSFLGQLVTVQKRFVPQRRSQILTAIFKDDTATIELVWYRAPGFLSEKVLQGKFLLIHGKVERAPGGRLRMIHPDFEVMDDGEGEDPQLQRIVTIYSRPGGLPLSLLRKWIAQAIELYAQYLASSVPANSLKRLGLMPLAQALGCLHDPALDSDLDALNRFDTPAHRAIIFDELFFLQLGLGLRRQRSIEHAGRLFPRQEAGLTTKMIGLLPFKLTGAQRRVLLEIDADMNSASPMQRLVQGDVGSGKTMVAWLASLRVIQHGYQALWMAPTELLAEQHYNGLKRYCDALGLRGTLLTASVGAKEKRQALTAIESGEIQFVVGTHALIQESVRAPRMGLGVIDEQHRFGVLQRMSLQNLVQRDGERTLEDFQPHMLLMSATPIPRSLAMVLYGDLEVSFLDEMPPGRTPIRTKVFGDKNRAVMYQLVLEQIQQGHQVFIVYPLVEASEQLQQIRDATRMAEELSLGVFREHKVGLVHGRMRNDERDATMREFRDGKLQILVATTVIEVGIDIPNATVMIVEHAERFGLSQLHQLRGRVGRGKAAGFCLLAMHSYSPEAAKRLRVMEQQSDGFKIAEADMELRGPGELLGTRQSGMADFRLANLARDQRLLVEARKEALAWLEKDPQLKSQASVLLREILQLRWGQKLQLGAVG